MAQARATVRRKSKRAYMVESIAKSTLAAHFLAVGVELRAREVILRVTDKKNDQVIRVKLKESFRIFLWQKGP
uniref:50S ribosomal protein L23 n=1 Tax=Steinernema glaseri TaxID=37863 RepID=A0A1I7ZUU5_9BILA